MEEGRRAFNILTGKPTGKSPLERHLERMNPIKNITVISL